MDIQDTQLATTASIKYRAVLWSSAVRFSQPLFFLVERKTLRKALHFMLANRCGAFQTFTQTTSTETKDVKFSR